MAEGQDDIVEDEGATASPYAASINAMWHDPSSFDPVRDGPPYLPGPKTASVRMASTDRAVVRTLVTRMRKSYGEGEASPLGQILSHLIADYQKLPMAELAALLSCLRSVALIHQTHHWQTRGNTFFGDHLLYERLYNDSLLMIDQLAERAIGSGGEGSHLLVHPVIQSSQVHSVTKFLIGDIQADPNPDAYALLSFVSEVRLLAVLAAVYEALKVTGQLSPGTDNLLQGIADKHEEFVYLLRQRCSSKVSYRR